MSDAPQVAVNSKDIIKKQVQKIYYTDCIPGSGKTHWAIEKINQHISKPRNIKSSVILYCAPTKALLIEVYNKIKDTAQDRVHLIFSKTNNIDSVEAALESSFDFLNRIYESGDLNYIQKSKNSLSNRMSRKNATLGIYPGDVVLITHAALWNAYFSDQKNTFKCKDKISLIIDEARDCYVTSLSFSLCSAEIAIDFKKYLGFKDQSEFCLINPELLSKARLEEGGFRESQFKSKYKRIFDEFAKHSQKSNIELYAVVRKEFASNRFLISIIRAPYDALMGWKNVFALSAFYSSSQLYNLLESIKSHPQLKEKYQYNQINVTSKIINKQRYAQLKKRLENVNISWIYDSSVSYTKYKNYVPYVYPSNKVYLETAIENYQNLYSASKNTVFKYYSNIPQLKDYIKFLTDNDTLRWDTSYDTFCVELLDTAKSYEDEDFTKAVNVILENKREIIYPTNPTTFASMYSLEIMKRWIKSTYNKDIEKDSYLLSVNISNPNIEKKRYEIETIETTQEVSFSHINSEDNEDNDIDDNRYENWKENVTNEAKEYAVPLLGDVRGLNNYKNYDNLVLISSYLPPVELVNWFSKFCPAYNPYLDFSLGQTIQIMMRCSMRNIESNSTVFIVLNSKEMANDIKNRLLGLPSLISPEAFNLPKADLIAVQEDVANYADLPIQRKQAILQNAKNYYKSKKYYYKKLENLLDLHKVCKDFFISERCYDIKRKINIIQVQMTRLQQKTDNSAESVYKEKQKEVALLRKQIKDIKKLAKQDFGSSVRESFILMKYGNDIKEKYKKNIITAKEILQKLGYTNRDAVNYLKENCNSEYAYLLNDIN